MQFTNNFMFDKLSDRAKAGIKAAIVSRGWNVGCLKERTPSRWDNPDGYTAWQAIMLELCPQRVSMGGLMMLSADQKELFYEIEGYCRKMHRFINENLQHPFQFNLYHYHEEPEEDTEPEPVKIDPNQLTLF